VFLQIALGALGLSGGKRRYVKKTLLHQIENRGHSDLVFLEMFKADRFQDFWFLEWLAHTPPELVMAHLNIDKAILDAIPKEPPLITLI
jgi:oxalate decarboxylase